MNRRNLRPQRPNRKPPPPGARLAPLAAILEIMRPLRPRHTVAALAAVLVLALGAAPARAQGTWTGVGAIGRTAMFMDTTSIVRDGDARRVWLESVDPEPTTIVMGRDSVRFDTVIALHVFDCRARTHAVTTARYYLGRQPVLPPRPADTRPERLRPGSFLDAVARDLCGRR